VLFVGKLQIDWLFGVVVVGIGGGCFVLLLGLRLAAIALLAEGEVEVAAIEADPVSLPHLRNSIIGLDELIAFFRRGQIIHSLNLYLNLLTAQRHYHHYNSIIIESYAF
jgi:hypothetical protein